MSTLAAELDAHLRRLDARTAEHVERVVREVLALTAAAPEAASEHLNVGDGLLKLAEAAEPLGAMTNEEIDRTVYGR